jgi:hypothetical protein
MNKYIFFQKLIFLFFLSFFFAVACKKPTTPSGGSSSMFEGKYNGPMLQNGPGSFKDYKTGPQTFEVFNTNSNKISIKYSANQFIADATLNGSNFSIIPTTVEYGVTRIDITGYGKFKTDSMQIVWTQKQFSKSGSTYVFLDTIQLKGTLKKL